MPHRHLLPEDIDLLLDADAGSGPAPLRDHVASCASCRTRVAEARLIADALDGLAYDTPSVGFADRVMARVDVFEPWHVAALDTVRRLVPQSAAGRVVAGVGAGLAVASLSSLGVAAALHAEAVLFAAELAVDRFRIAAVDAVAATIAAVAGEQAWAAMQSGGAFAVVSVACAAAASLTLAAVGLRALVSTRRHG